MLLQSEYKIYRNIYRYEIRHVVVSLGIIRRWLYEQHHRVEEKTWEDGCATDKCETAIDGCFENVIFITLDVTIKGLYSRVHVLFRVFYGISADNRSLHSV